jgi:organic radical activating enzyme
MRCRCSWCDSRFAWDPSLHPLLKLYIIVNNVILSGTDSVVVTGGEPLMWNLDYLCSCLKSRDIKTFIETSGAYPLSESGTGFAFHQKKKCRIEQHLQLADELKVIIQDRNDFRWAEKYRNLVRKGCLLFCSLNGNIFLMSFRNCRIC